MTMFATSSDGTRIAFDRVGGGPAVIVVAGMFCDRARMAALSQQLARRFTVFNYDRRGRGESGDAPSYAVEREIEDLATLIAEAGGSAMVYGHSSGAGLALRAAASGLPITRLILHEPPYGTDDDESRSSARALAETVRTAIAEGRRTDAIAAFFVSAGMPPQMVDGMACDPSMVAIAPTMPYDFEVMGDTGGGTIPVSLVQAIRIATLVLAGTASPDFFRDTATRLTELLSHGRLEMLDGHDHGAPGEVVAPVVSGFFSEAPDA